MVYGIQNDRTDQTKTMQKGKKIKICWWGREIDQKPSTFVHTIQTAKISSFFLITQSTYFELFLFALSQFDPCGHFEYHKPYINWKKYFDLAPRTNKVQGGWTGGLPIFFSIFSTPLSSWSNKNKKNQFSTLGPFKDPQRNFRDLGSPSLTLFNLPWPYRPYSYFS